MLSPRGQRGLKAKFFGLCLSLVVSGLGLVLGLVQHWPRSYLGWRRGLVVNHQNLVMNELQPSVTEYLSASSKIVSIAKVVSKLSDIGIAMALTLSFDTIMTAIAIFHFLELNSN